MARTPLRILLEDEVVESLRAAHEHRTDVCVSLLDRDMAVLWATEPGATAIYGRDETEYQGVGARYFVHPADFADYGRAFAQAMQGTRSTWEGRCSDGDGNWIWTDVTMHRTASGEAIVCVSRRGGVAD